MIESCSGEDVADRRSDGHGNGDVNHGAVVMMKACDELDDDDVGRSDGGTVVVADGANNDDSDFSSSGDGDGAGDNNDFGCTGSTGGVMVLVLVVAVSEVMETEAVV